MRRFSWCFLFPLLLVQCSLRAQQVPAMTENPEPGVIAVPCFAGDFGDTFADLLLTRLLSSGEVALVERDELDTAARELKFQHSKVSNAETAQKLGEMVNARYVLLGRATRAPAGMLQVTVRLVEVATGKLVPGIAVSRQIDPADKQEYQQKMYSIADDLLAALRNAGLTISPPNGQVQAPESQLPAAPAYPQQVQPSTLLANLQVTSIPAGSEVLVDGADTGKTTPCLLEIDMGCRTRKQVDIHCETRRLLPPGRNGDPFNG